MRAVRVRITGRPASMANDAPCLSEGRQRIVLPETGYTNTRAMGARTAPARKPSRFCSIARHGAVEAGAAPPGARVAEAETPTNPLTASRQPGRLGELAADEAAPMIGDKTVANAMRVKRDKLELGRPPPPRSPRWHRWTRLTKTMLGHSDVRWARRSPATASCCAGCGVAG